MTDTHIEITVGTAQVQRAARDLDQLAAQSSRAASALNQMGTNANANAGAVSAGAARITSGMSSAASAAQLAARAALSAGGSMSDAMRGASTATQNAAAQINSALAGVATQSRASMGAMTEAMVRSLASIDASISQLNTRLTTLPPHIDQSSNSLRGLGGNAASVSSIFGAFGIAIGAVGFAQLSKDIFSINVQFENMQIQARAVFGSMETGMLAIKQAQQLDLVSPFNLAGIEKAMIKLKTMGLEPTEKVMKSLLDTAAFIGQGDEGLSGFILQLGQAWGKGKLQLVDANLMMQRGIPIIEAFTKATGLQREEFYKMSESGTIGRDIILKMIEVMGEITGGSAGLAMDSMTGKISNLDSAWGKLAATFKETPMWGWIKEGIELVTYKIDAFRELLEKFNPGAAASLDAQVTSQYKKVTSMQTRTNPSKEWLDQLTVESQKLEDLVKTRRVALGIAEDENAAEIASKAAAQKRLDESVLKQTEVNGVTKEGLALRSSAMDDEIAKVKQTSSAEVEIIKNKITEIDMLYQAGSISVGNYFESKAQLINQQFDAQAQALKEQLGIVSKALDDISDNAPAFNVKVNTEGLTKQVADALQAASQKYGVDPNLVKAIMAQESNFKVDAKSDAGAVGLMQVMPATFNAYGVPKEKWFDVPTNVDTGVKLLAEELKRFNNNRTLATAAYNAGSPAVKKYDGVPPYKETQNYVKQVDVRYQSYSGGKEFTAGIATDEKASIELHKESNILTLKQSELKSGLKSIESQRIIALKQNTAEEYKLIQAVNDKGRTAEEVFNQEMKHLDELRDAGARDGKPMSEEGYNAAAAESLGRFLKAAQEQYTKEFSTLSAKFKDGSITQFEDSVKELNRAYEIGAIDLQQYEKYLKKATDAFNNADDGAAQFKSVMEGLDQAILQASGSNFEIFLKQIEKVKNLGQREELIGKFKLRIEAEDIKATLDSLKSGMQSALSGILDGTKSFGEAFKGIFDSVVNQILNTSIKNLVDGFSNALSGAGWGQFFGGLVGVAASAIGGLISSSGKSDAPSIAQTSTNKNIIGLSAFSNADKGTRSTFEQSMIPTIQNWNRAVDTASALIRNNATTIVDFAGKYLGSIFTNLGGSGIVSAVKGFADGVKGAYTTITGYADELIGGVGKIVSNAFNAVTGATTAMSSAIAGFAGLQGAAGAATSAEAVAGAWSAGVQAGSTTFAGGVQAGQSAASGASASSSGVTTNDAMSYLAIIKLGYDLFQIAGQKFTSTLNKVSQGFYAAESAAVSVLGVANPIAWVVGAILRVAGAATQMASGDWMGGVSNLLGGHIGGMIADAFKESPSATILSRSLDYQDSNARLSADGTFRTSHSRDSATVEADSALGIIGFRLNAIGDNWEAVAEETEKSFLPLLKTIVAFDNAMAASIRNTDDLNNSTIDTVDGFRKLFNYQFESQKDIKGLSSSSLIVDRMDDIAKTMGKVGTNAGDAFSVWWTAFSSKLLKPQTQSNNEYNTITAFNVEAFIAARLPQLAELPKRLADLFVESVTSVADGATQEQFQKQFTDFFGGWEYAKAGLKQIGMDIEQTAIPEYLSSLVGLGLTVGESAKALVSFAGTFDKAAGDVTQQFNAAFDKIFSDAKTMGETKAQTSGRVGSYITLANTAKDIGLTATNAELDNLSKKLNATAIAATADANAVIDQAIAENNLIGVSRKSAIQQLVLAGKLDETKIAAADFSKALTDAQAEMLGGINLAQSQAVFFGTTLTNMGLNFNQVANIGQNVTLAFKDLAEEMNFLDSVARAVMSETDYAAGKKAQAQATFDSSAKALGMDGYSIDQFKGYAGIGGKYQADLLAAQADGDTARLNSLKNLGSSAITLTETTKNYTEAVTTASKTTDDAADKAKKLDDLQKQVDNDLRRMGLTDFAKGLDDIRQKIAELADQAKEAGGSLKNLTQLQNAQIVEYLKTFTDPITQAFSDIGKTDMQKSMEKIKKDLKDVIANINEAAKQGLASKDDVSTYTGQAAITAMSQARDVFKPLVDEFNNIGKSDVKKSLEGISQWHDDALRSVNDIAMAYGITTQQAIDGINAIADARTEALQKDLNATIKKSALDEQRAQKDFSLRNNQEAASLSGTLNGIIDSYSQTILTMAASGATLKQMMPTYTAALASGSRATQLAIESVAKAYAQVYKQINDVNNTVSDKILTLQGGDVADAQKQRALADLQSTDLNTQLEAVNKLISLNETKYQNEIKIATYLNNLMLSAASPLSAVQKRDLAKSQFEKNLAGAKANDQTSIDNLGSSFDTYLEQQKSLSTSSVDYARVFQRGLAQIGDLAGGGKGTLDQKAKQAALDQVSELQKLQKILIGTNGILDQQKQKQGDVEASLLAAAAAAKQSFDAILLANKDITDALDKGKVSDSIYDGFIQNIADALKNAGFSNAQINAITGSLTGVAESLMTMLSSKVASSETISKAETYIGNFVNGVGVLLEKGLLSKDSATTISTSVLNTFKGFTDLLNNHLINEPQYNKILDNETAFLTLINKALTNGTIKQGDADALIVSRNTLTNNIVRSLTNGTIDLVQAGQIYTLRETAFNNMAAFLANAHLTPANQSLVIDGFSTMATNTGLVLASQGMTPEQIGLISLGYGATANNVKLDLDKLGLTKEQKDLYNMGVTTFSTNIKDGVGGITTGQTALDLINGGVNNLATNMFTGLSSVEWLTPAANIVQGGVNALATNIATFLSSISTASNNPAQTAVNNTAGVIAQFDALIKSGDYLGAASYGKGAGYDAVDMALRASQIGVGTYEDNLTFLRAKGYATGGDHPGGLRIVGEDGAEAEFTGASRIMSHQQTRDMFGNDAVREEVSAMREELKQSQKDNQQLQLKMAMYMKKVADLAERSESIGTPPVRAV